MLKSYKQILQEAVNKCPPGTRWCPIKKKCIPAGQEQGQGKRQARGQGKGPMGQPTKEDIKMKNLNKLFKEALEEPEPEDDTIDITRPYDHPTKRTVLKEPPVVAKGNIPIKKVQETLSRYNKYYSLTEAKQVIKETK